ncbi:YheO-like / HTH domain multi-domain protein [Lachnoanaerobaculum saburreum F0468]|jgi:possible transcriptional regulator|uniref:YheO-like / HTH domain multi-domain protein n=1 Tax=Lachnoanaerobaculum saburreum F0468 TaxID=1095750 RepID=I0R9I4_9FIRM|nr:PAS domain-containing protein [Lachnoanaerobaculum saburreum]EIC96342.1 YheO-like / HTH domain multi-domain protein [Lachnoanaerobaculum saburreum F0468]
MNEFDINRYIDISNFLGTLLGPDYEIIIYDLNYILHTVNGEISGRKAGDTISPAMKTILSIKKSFDKKWISNYRALSGNGKILRCSTFYIRDTGNNLIGAMNISFDDNRYKELSNLVFSLCHPDNYVSKNISIEIKGNTEQELFSDSISNAIDEILHRIDRELPFSKLSHIEKLNIIKQLYQKGIFSMKGAVKTVGHRLSCSTASMYRYLDIVKKDNKV